MAWTQQRILTALLNGGALFLLVDTLIEHRFVLTEEWLTWIGPMVALAMTAVLFITWLRWTAAMRRLAWWAMWLPVAGGLLGFVIHTNFRMERGVANYFHHGGPPMLAPLAFFGLGLMGLVVFSKRYEVAEAAPAVEAEPAA